MIGESEKVYTQITRIAQIIERALWESRASLRLCG